MKKSLFALLLCAGAAWFYFTPFMAVNRLQAAAESGDSQAMNEMVDFPALRTSIKSEIQGSVARGIQKDGGPFAALGSAVTGMIVEPVVNAAVTPEGISLLMKGRSPGGDDDSAENDENWRERTKITRRWEASDRFVVRYSDRESGNEQIALIMRRDGLNWRLSGVRFPAGAATE
ncbi:MAG TPA: DUF2939 domain-containing protein [Longimicrobium sp.]|nr:DUF2939 domain-containing protein [Longimicrobium sp.]